MFNTFMTFIKRGSLRRSSLIVAVFTLSNPVEARPELFLALKQPQMIGYARDSMIVVTNEGTLLAPKLRMRRPGIVPLDRTGHFKWGSDELWRRQGISPNDQINLTDEMFGSSVSTALKFSGCVPQNGIRIQKNAYDSDKNVAWLASCGPEIIKRLPTHGQQVAVDFDREILSSKSYQYKYKTKNHMLFDSIKLRTVEGIFLPFTHDADLLIRADVRNFFTLQFDSEDIESHMRATRIEEFGALATMQFYLKILFFKLTLDLDTDIAFYSSSSHIPMVLTVPKNAEKRLNLKSGILYSFVLDENVTPDPSSRMPKLNPSADLIDGGVANYCLNDLCQYSIRFTRDVDAAKSEFSIELSIPKNLVERGMYPRFVEDAVEQGKEMGWHFSKQQKEKRRHGIYFEVSRLPAGEHAWDLWLGLKP